MSFVLTYTSLVANIMNYLERSDTATQQTIPMFILLAQDRIAKECKTLGLETYVTGVFTPSVAVVPKPAGWKNTITFNIGTVVPQPPPPAPPQYLRTQLPQRSYEFCRMYWPNQTLTGLPIYFCDYGYDNWLVTPTPDQAYPFEIAYMSYVQPIDGTTQTNWLTQYAPEVLFYACMLEAMVYLKDDDRLQVWQQLYQDALAKLDTEDKARYTDRYSDRGKD